MDNDVQYMDGYEYLHGTKQGNFCSSLHNDLNLQRESEQGETSNSSTSKYFIDDDKNNDVAIDAQLFNENVVKKEDVRRDDNVNPFGREK